MTKLAAQHEQLLKEFRLITAHLQTALPIIATGSGKDLVLFIGGTGAGKSTLLNYLNGSEYRLEYDEYGNLLAIYCGGSAEIAKVGHSMISETSAPQFIATAHGEYLYCDLAGLVDSRGTVAKIFTASTMHLIAQKAAAVKSIVVVLDIPGFQSLNGDAFRNTAIALNKILQNNPDVFNAVHFVVTKAPLGAKVTPQGILKHFVSNMIRAPGGLLSMAMGPGLSADNQALLNMLQLMELPTASIIVADIADQSQTRTLIADKIASTAALVPSKFDFLSFVSEQTAFNQMLQAAAQGFVKLKRRLELDIGKEIAQINASTTADLLKLDKIQEQLREQRREYARCRHELKILDREIVEFYHAVARAKLCCDTNNCVSCANDTPALMDEIIAREKRKAQYSSKSDPHKISSGKIQIQNVMAHRDKNIAILQEEAVQIAVYLTANNEFFRSVEQMTRLLMLDSLVGIKEFWQELANYETPTTQTTNSNLTLRG
jgi:energy-coupling factor transporter ATP-binding protein EcfA2